MQMLRTIRCVYIYADAKANVTYEWTSTFYLRRQRVVSWAPGTAPAPAPPSAWIGPVPGDIGPDPSSGWAALHTYCPISAYKSDTVQTNQENREVFGRVVIDTASCQKDTYFLKRTLQAL